MDKLFKEVNFVFEYREELETFFRPYFEDEQSMYSFFASVFQNDDKDKNPRRIMNQISRFVSLANDIAKIRPGRDP
ncbi:MAG: hypothetical protein IJO77_04525, partial [Oscillospiraceae bacterium]|nr:hypothetical protein [Oscillospiraceae bacterium]